MTTQFFGWWTHLNISISNYLKNRLDKVKNRDEHTSYDSVIRTLYLKDKGVTVVCRKHNCTYNSSEQCTSQTIEVQGTCKTYTPEPSRIIRTTTRPVEVNF